MSKKRGFAHWDSERHAMPADLRRAIEKQSHSSSPHRSSGSGYKAETVDTRHSDIAWYAQLQSAVHHFESNRGNWTSEFSSADIRELANGIQSSVEAQILISALTEGGAAVARFIKERRG
jgi:hypothetical protein